VGISAGEGHRFAERDAVTEKYIQSRLSRKQNLYASARSSRRGDGPAQTTTVMASRQQRERARKRSHHAVTGTRTLGKEDRVAGIQEFPTLTNSRFPTLLCRRKFPDPRA
jgi:hypothetical protein